jgi:glycosyltransferase involved in cell wall biosynthesis
MKNLPPYTVAIRTLGTAGEKYQRLLNSLVNQTHQPNDIIVYIAEGYDLPKETCGRERYVYVKKGMVAQRALQYNEVKTEWILFLDDDIEIPNDGIAKTFQILLKNNADVIALDMIPHFDVSLLVKIKMAVLLSAIPRFWSKKKGYTVNKLGSYNYNPYRSTHVGLSTTNTGAAFICRKQDFQNIHFEEDLWLDESPYAIPDDQVMFYKMHLNGLTILTQYHSGWLHLDAGTATSANRSQKIAYSTARNHVIFYGLYIQPYLKMWQIPLVFVANLYKRLASQLIEYAKGVFAHDFSLYKEAMRGRRDGVKYLKSTH